MSGQERWDVAIRVLEGPLVGIGEQILRGPVVRIGANPGPGGLALAGYRGLDARHAVITAYDKGTASIAPVGSAQVRMAPHPHVDWKEIEPMSGPEYLSEGCALHLGPVGRGCTIEFSGCRKLGVWEQGRLASEVAGAAVAGDKALGKRAGVPLAIGGAPPASFDARKTSRISANSIPIWFVGCLTMMTAFTVALMAVLVVVRQVRVKPLGPEEDGLEFYDYADISKVDPVLLDGLAGGYQEFVMNPNGTAAGRMGIASNQEEWDQTFYKYTTASLEAHIKAWAVFKRLDDIRDKYATVTRMVREAGLPEAFAAIPYQESRYNGDAKSLVCAGGYWQFMPEVAYRVQKTSSIGFRVENCKLRGVETRWSPSTMTPPPNVLKNGPYMRDEKCIIESCAVDDRSNLEKSTKAAILTLKEAWLDPDIAGSGAAVQMAITSHNAGYDDAKFGVPKKTNVKPAYMKFKGANGKGEWHKFQGAMITTPTPHEKGWNGSSLPPEAQHYAYTILAQHLIAVCYYGQNYGSVPEFKPWAKFAGSAGYCKAMDIPDKQKVQTHKFKGPVGGGGH